MKYSYFFEERGRVMKYPIEIQIFEQIIEDGYVYADKTELVYRLISERAESGKRGLCGGDG